MKVFREETQMKPVGYENPVNVMTMEKTLTDRSNAVRKGPSQVTPETLHSDWYCLFGSMLGFKVHISDDPAIPFLRICPPEITA